MQKLINILSQSFSLEKLNAEEFAKLKVKGMHFTIERYWASGLGNVSVMSAKGFFGLMQMNTLIINPTERDMPLFSYDRVYAMGNDTLIVELYDTWLKAMSLEVLQKVKDTHKDLPEHDLGTHWYDTIKLAESVSKKGKKKQTPAFDKLAEDYFAAYIKLSKAAASCDPVAKKEKASVYVEGLLKNGGPSTDIFKQHFGAEKTGDLFRRILFGTE